MYPWVEVKCLALPPMPLLHYVKPLDSLLGLMDVYRETFITSDCRNEQVCVH